MIRLKETKETPQGKLECYELKNALGMSVEIINYGARIHHIFIPDVNGVLRDVVIGFDNIEEYIGSENYFNAVIGRVANRIGGAAFELNGKKYQLFKNDGENCLHGGRVGFDSVFWKASVEGDALKLTHFSRNMEEGFPGNLSVVVRYALEDDGSLRISYKAVSDEDTPCSLTNHAYFNLSGDFSKTVLSECLRIKSDAVTAVDAALIPTGEITPVKNTALDFNAMKEIGEEIEDDNEFLKIAGGYDFNYILKERGNSYAAKAFDPKTCIAMEVFTDMPCMQFYSGNFLNGQKGRAVFGKNCAFCLETQLYPNACNVPSFPSAILKKGEVFSSETRYKFSLFRSEA